MRIDSEAPFKTRPGAPAPLGVSIARKIRFGECDPMGVVWHGTYTVYAEEAREALAEACGFPYEVIRRAGVVMPIKAIFFDYRRPLRFGLEYSVTAVIHWTDAVRVNMEYMVFDTAGALCTKGFSVQLLTDFSGSLVLDWPPFYSEFLERWRMGGFSGLHATAQGASRTAAF